MPGLSHVSRSPELPWDAKSTFAVGLPKRLATICRESFALYRRYSKIRILSDTGYLFLNAKCKSVPEQGTY